MEFDKTSTAANPEIHIAGMVAAMTECEADVASEIASCNILG
jgi:hypothetical protein